MIGFEVEPNRSMDILDSIDEFSALLIREQAAHGLVGHVFSLVLDRAEPGDDGTRENHRSPGSLGWLGGHPASRPDSLQSTGRLSLRPGHHDS